MQTNQYAARPLCAPFFVVFENVARGVAGAGVGQSAKQAHIVSTLVSARRCPRRRCILIPSQRRHDNPRGPRINPWPSRQNVARRIGRPMSAAKGLSDLAKLAQPLIISRSREVCNLCLASCGAHSVPGCVRPALGQSRHFVPRQRSSGIRSPADEFDAHRRLVFNLHGTKLSHN